MVDTSDTQSAILTALSDCVPTILANDLAYGLCITNSGLFDLIPSNFTTNYRNALSTSRTFNTDGNCRIMCTKPTSAASASCCAATIALQACTTSSSYVKVCKDLIDDVFTYQSECKSGLSSATITLITITTIVIIVLLAMIGFSRSRIQNTKTFVNVTSTWTQVTNLIWKNLVLRRRRPVSFFFELFLPVFLSTALLLLANLDSFTDSWRSTWLTSEAANFSSNSTLVCSRLTIWGLEAIGGPSSSMLSFYSGGQSVLGLFFLISYIKFVSTTTTTMVVEKETRMRQMMKIMGLSDTTLLISWILTTAMFATPLSFAIAAVLKYGNVFSRTEYATLVFLFWALSIAITAFGYCIAPFFHKSRSAAIASVLLWLILFFPFLSVQSTNTNTFRYVAALSPPTAFALAVDEMLRRAQLGSNFAYSVGLIENPITVPSAFHMTLFLLGDSLILITLGYYFEQVVPQEYGVSKPWQFLFSPSYWFRQKAVRLTCDTSATLSPQTGCAYTEFTDVEMSDHQENVRTHLESVHAGLTIQEQNGSCLELRNLRKVFQLDHQNERIAVANLNMKMYHGQITALLGHNGAGKTTILSMLTGLIEPTSGDAFLYGCSIKHEFEKLRRMIGICPQYDILYSDLTVEEHFQFFGRMKYLSFDKLQVCIDKMIQEIGLMDIRHVLIKTLSGGQKRKVSVGLAFLGENKLVFLDEPTSGMDPYSRRFTWKLLQQNREDRVIVLTTHFMDEADLLGDRIAILSHGHLRCMGSSLFLKTRFGAGYNLTLIKILDGSYNDKVMEGFLQKYIQDIKCLSHAGSEVVFQLPTISSKIFPFMLNHLDHQMQQLGIQQYGISVTTLEEVFLRIANESMDHTVQSLKSERTFTPINRFILNDISFWTHYRAQIIKRFLIAKRDLKTIFFAVGIPSIFLLLLASLPEIQVAHFIPNYASNLPSTREQSQCNASTNLTSLIDPNFNVQTCTMSRGFAYCTLGVVQCDMRTCCDGTNFVSPWYPCNTCNTAMCFNTICMDKDDAKLQVILNGYLKALLVLLAFAFIPSAIVAYIVREKDPNQNAKSLQLISGANVSAYWVANWTHDFTLTIIPIVMAAIIVPFTITPNGGENATHDDILAICALLVTHIWVILPLAYLFARRYVNHAIAQTALLVFSLGTGALLSMFSFLCRIVDFRLSNTFTISSLDRNYLRWIFMLFPGYTLNNGLFELATRKVSRKALFGAENSESSDFVSFFGLFSGLGNSPCTECWDRIEPSCCVRKPFDLEIAGAPLLYKIIQAIVLSILVFVIETRSLKWKTQMNRLDHCSVTMESEDEEDDDVQVERQRVECEDQTSNDLVFIRNLRHEYAGKPCSKIAIDNLSLSIRKRECFGYLGVNGAGKSTTLAILTGQLAPTNGFVTLDGLNLASKMKTIRQRIGFCPQFDALHDLLTVEEELEFYARLKGISEPFVKLVIDEKIQELELTIYRTTLTHKLSGGNKRKVSTAIALLGCPRIVFLDEPTTGVDPFSRRKMWNLITQLTSSERDESACVVLTTHSMEECEALCSRVGILVTGRLKCLGSVEYLKQKFGYGYTVEVTLCTLNSESEEVKKVYNDVHLLVESERNQMVTIDSIRPLCTALGYSDRGVRILNQEGTGWILGNLLDTKGAISIQTFVLWWVLETCGEQLCAFFEHKFPGTILAEQQGKHFRFQVPKYQVDSNEVVRPAAVFRALEQTRSSLYVDEYSVSETALEHIFNNMAAQQDKEEI
ncbi:atp-binding cassette superfamily [Plasmopara halstedii]|uniref:Atp-binding cassette superfamily n=1 Tax=Plasmopara halstedii TaxID=4781 RepID=A0A0P1AAT8_PLAHL|nr:atp-binding cassette superfamily [Plasmopara halstedii]CEG37378.1 atp-binding cassette superfamily [Plasmopara halstedii]|eukprot:XP_024573747.1 atp-binding cassette superfamily [Plasmopara halstedii]